MINIYLIPFSHLERLNSSFELYDPPITNVEIYSATEIVSTKVKDAEIVDRKIRKKESARMFRKRKKFFNRELAERYVKEKAEKGEI